MTCYDQLKDEYKGRLEVAKGRYPFVCKELEHTLKGTKSWLNLNCETMYDMKNYLQVDLNYFALIWDNE
jgi:hypothetical protein